jgi:PEP-CTERM motif
VSPSFRTARWIGLASVFVFVAAAAFGAKLWHKTPRDFFLSLATDSATAEPTLPEVVRDQPTASAGSFARVSGGGGSTRLDALPPAAASGVGASAGAIDRRSGAGSAWTPWGSGSTRRGLNGSTFSSGSAALGGLWHSMSPFGGHGAGAAATPATMTARAEPAPKQAKPAPAKPAPKPSSPSSPSSPATPSSGSSPSAAPPSIAAPSTGASAVPSAASGSLADPGGGLGEHQAPLPEIGGGSAPTVGPIGGGGSGRGGVSTPGDVSASPEPGTIALVGTGLLGLIGVFRRRRA